MLLQRKAAYVAATAVMGLIGIGSIGLDGGANSGVIPATPRPFSQASGHKKVESIMPAEPITAPVTPNVKIDTSNQPLEANAPATEAAVTIDVSKLTLAPKDNAETLDSDPFKDSPSDGGAGAAAPADSVVTTLAGSTIPIDPELLRKFKGIEILAEMNIPVPTLAFTYDSSADAVKRRMDANIEKYQANMPAEVAKFKAQLDEREMKSRALRASHNQKRTIVRLMQEARLKKDAAGREQRMVLLQMKQDQAKKQMEESAKELAEQRAQQEEQRKERETKNEAERKKVEEQKEMMRKLREGEMARLNAENEKRRQEEKADKVKDAQMREEKAQKERESKRKMIEEFQTAVQAQMEDQKRLAREDRIKEAQEAREARLQMEQDLAISTRALNII